jgi:hypothetical protein
VDCCGEACVGFVVSCGDAAERFDLAEEVLNQMAPFVHLGVMGNRDGAVGLGRNDGNRATLGDQGADGVAVEGFVGQQGGELYAIQHRFDADAVMSLAWQQDEAPKVPQRIDDGQDLGRQPATRATDGLSLSPPLAPVPC